MKFSILKGHNIFLIDAIGAITSAFCLLLPYTFQTIFGMPAVTVRTFIVIAILLSIYSVTIFLTKPKNRKPFLSIVAVLNMSYCLYTAIHLIKNQLTLTLPGLLYFVAEILIILTLSVIELRLSRSLQTTSDEVG
jgi:amino acid transporter